MGFQFLVWIFSIIIIDMGRALSGGGSEVNFQSCFKQSHLKLPPDLPSDIHWTFPVCVNNNLNDIRLIYDFTGHFEWARKFDWNNRGTKYIGDPDKLLGSNCTLIVWEESDWAEKWKDWTGSSVLRNILTTIGNWAVIRICQRWRKKPRPIIMIINAYTTLSITQSSTVCNTVRTP